MKWLLSLLILLLLFTSSCQESLPTIHIEKENSVSFDEKTKCNVIYDYQKTIGSFDASIKYRGGMSIGYPKLSYSLELDDKFSLANLPKDDDWILNASYIDKTFMRHKICYDLFRKMNPNNQTAQSSYVTLSFNEEEQGLYILMQEINAGMLNINKDDSMAMLFKDPVVFFDTMPELTQEPDNYFQQKYPKIYKKDHSDFLLEFRDFIFNASDSVFIQNIHKWVDIENIIDWHLMILLSNNSDGILKNFYLYKLDSQTPFRIAIWDCDHSFGRDGDNEYNMMDRPVDIYRNILLRRLMTYPTYQNQLKNRWWQLREVNVFSVANINQMIAENHKKIKGHIHGNFEIWGLEQGYYDNNSYEQEIEIIKEFVSLRLEQLDEYFSSLD